MSTKVIATVEMPLGNLSLSHPSISEIPELISLFQKEDLDLRRLVFTAKDGYPSLGEEELKKRWQERIMSLTEEVVDPSLRSAIIHQSEGILAYRPIPKIGTIITDPFHMSDVEKDSNIESLQKSQLSNILMMKQGDMLVAAGRVLPVEGAWEIVSIVTKPEYRKKGLATILIKRMLEIYSQRPLFSFQTVDLVPFYIKTYASAHSKVPPFSELPLPQQRDLFYMNIFWGPNVILSLEE